MFGVVFSDGLQCLTFCCSRGVILPLHSVHVFLGIAVLIQSLLFHTKLLCREVALLADTKTALRSHMNLVFFPVIPCGLNFLYTVCSMLQYLKP